MYTFFVKGGPVMWPLLVCSIVSVAITIERLLFWLRHHRGTNQRLIEDMLARTERGDFEGAVSASSGVADVAACVLHSGLAQRAHGLTESMEVAAEREIARMKRGLGILDTIITLAPLLGILGTVFGIIESFDLLGQGGIDDPRAVTGGIAQALITTAAGLSVAIVTLIPYNYLVHAVERVTSELGTAATRMEVAYRKGLEKRNASA
jgi:biopolymer transport protein ExbB